jgi:lipopolysaccharide transport system ATP-binding protein
LTGGTVIAARDLGKRYSIGTRPAGSLKEALARGLAGGYARLRGRRTVASSNEVWALKNISFDVSAGEIVGLVGRNGAGKSTLLKLLSRITAPTEGRAVIRGRVGSLLEVGTGFHPDLTGRDNAYLSGAILGMKKAEIDRLFDQIVAFAEIERFIDTPVKHYSSGMYMRLAFAVAAHLETEIVLVDEVLAVGDIAFQQKCLGKMGDVAASGRTVILVSHNMQAVRALCPRTIVLGEGAVIADGPTGEALRAYDALAAGSQVDAATGVRDVRFRRGSGAARFTSIEVQDDRGNECWQFEPGDTIRFVLTFDVYENLSNLVVAILFRSGLSKELVTSLRHTLSSGKVEPATGQRIVIELPETSLRCGVFSLYFGLADSYTNAYDVVDDLTPPLVISSTKTFQELGYDASNHAGYFSVASTVDAQIPADRMDLSH